VILVEKGCTRGALYTGRATLNFNNDGGNSGTLLPDSLSPLFSSCVYAHASRQTKQGSAIHLTMQFDLGGVTGDQRSTFRCAPDAPSKPPELVSAVRVVRSKCRLDGGENPKVLICLLSPLSVFPLPSPPFSLPAAARSAPPPPPAHFSV